MNANELADELVWIAKNRGDSVSRQLADIVRQQQAEIEALKAALEQEGIGVGRDLLNGGIALFRKDKNEL